MNSKAGSFNFIILYRTSEDTIKLKIIHSKEISKTKIDDEK